MSREYDIKNAAWDYFQDLDSHHFHILPHSNSQTYAFESGAKCADKTMIEKACEWLKEKNKMCMYELEMILGRNFIEDFKKEMEGKHG